MNTTKGFQSPQPRPPSERPPRPKRLCSIEGCEKPHKSRGWCGAHYFSERYRSDPAYAERERKRKRDWVREKYHTNPEYADRQRKRAREQDAEQERKRHGEYRKRQMLLRLLPDRLWLVEQSWPKEVAIARLAIGGTTKAERETAAEKLELILKKEKREWLSQLIISSAMQTTRRVTSFPLSLESSREG